MFNEGDVVLQKNTLVNGVNFKDNKETRLSIVLFNYKDENGDNIVYTCPITNHIPNIKKPNNNILYVPYLLLTSKKLCSIKLDSTYKYPENELRTTGLKINNNIMLKVYDKLLNLENTFDLEQYNIIKENILKLKKKKNIKKLNYKNI